MTILPTYTKELQNIRRLCKDRTIRPQWMMELGGFLSRWRLFFLSPLVLMSLTSAAQAATALDLPVWIKPERLSVLLETMLVLSFLSFIPFLLIMTTSFLRIIVVLGLLRHALGTQQTPPTNILVGLGLILTFFLMMPTIQNINQKAFQPYMDKAISWNQAMEEGASPLRDFMIRQTRKKDLALTVKMAGISDVKTLDDLPFIVIVASFAMSELKTAFIIGFLVFIPFVIVDMVVASILMSLGMMMVPPTVVSLPLKLLLFVLMDGWNLLIQGLMRSVR